MFAMALTLGVQFGLEAFQRHARRKRDRVRLLAVFHRNSAFPFALHFMVMSGDRGGPFCVCWV